MEKGFLSYKHANGTIKLLYEKRGFQLFKTTLGENVYNEFNIDIKDSKAAPLFAFVDEYIVLLRIISQFHLLGGLEKSKSAIVFYRLAVRQIKHLTSIRLLCSYGLDSDARTILRLVHETSLVWTRCQLDSNFINEYEKSFGFKESNEFWHKYIKSSKTEKYIKEELKKRNLIWLGSLDKQIEHMKSVLSTTSHPSMTIDYITSSNEIFSDFIGVEKISDSSNLTLTYALMCVVMPFSVMPNLEDNLKIVNLSDVDFYPKNSKFNSAIEHYKEFKSMFTVLFLMVTRFSNELTENKQK